MIRALAGAVALGGLPLAALAQPAVSCRLALLLAIDVSSSVDAQEDALQRNGIAAALLDPEVQEAFLEGDLPVALAAYEWSGRYNQEILLEWRMIAGPADLVAAAEAISGSERSHDDFPTAMGYSLGYGAGMLARAPRCLYRTIDVAGDGENNDGFPPSHAYREFPFGEVTVNGLVINGGDFEGEVSLIDFYRDEVIRGPGAFIEIAQGFADYERAMRRKLIRELEPRAVGRATPARRDPGRG